MSLVIRIDREVGGYSIFKSLKELGECLQEQDAQTSNFDTEEDYYKENGRISLLSELTDTEKIKEEADIYCDLYTYSYVELTDRQVEDAFEDYMKKNNLKDNWGNLVEEKS
tara:strand:- start:227 stop:559 length:333 start_codon:yes stop_codon:yes gene_type:complete